MSTVGSSSGSGGGFKPCADCTCSRGLLYRQKQRSVLFKQLSRRNSGFYGHSEEDFNGGRSNSNNSLDNYSISESIRNDCATRNVNTTDRLLSLRKEMAKHDLACYIIPNEDEHDSEYVSFADQRRAFISGFTGSAGVAVVSRDLLNFNVDAPEGKSLLHTDGRYFIQAAQELDFNWTLNKQGVATKSWEEWCVEECIEMWKALGSDSKKVLNIGIDPKVFPYFKRVRFDALIAKHGVSDNVKLVAIEENLVDTIWGQFENEPSRNLQPVTLLDKSFSGEEFKIKREKLVKSLLKNSKKDISSTSSLYFVVSALDEICWLLNLRGSDIDYNPVFFSYLIIDGDKTVLFTDNLLDIKIEEYLKENDVEVQPYNNVWQYMVQSVTTSPDNLYYVPSNCSWAVMNKLENGSSKPNIKINSISSPLLKLKSIKNQFEIINARKAQVKDGVALAQYFAWLENELVSKGTLLDEYKAAMKLLKIRETLENFKGLSFETISSTGGNASIIHYSPPQENSSIIDPSKIYLCDSGSQFLEGTTDITRTIHFTKPKQEEIDNYTLVLKGNLALERLQFPQKTTNGYQLDVLARQFLWQYGLDYQHGTGHGVGSFLNVHEGPIGIGLANRSLIEHPFEHGQVVTNEPGYYKDGEYGIRIENDLLVVNNDENFKGFLKFENLTMVPYCKKLINVKLLTVEEKQQINTYHKKVFETVSHFLQPQSISFKWLKRECSSL